MTLASNLANNARLQKQTCKELRIT